ncbi:MAG: lysylphosphatidylglycerol synthase domain-containing protein [Elainellaceae cyanobacterium]
MRRASLLGILLGLSLLTALVLWQGAGLLAQTFSQLGWRIAWLPLVYLMPLGAALLSWRYLFPSGRAPRWGLLLYGVWLNYSINWLLPVGQVGGELARIRLLLSRKFASAPAIASIVGDQTLQLVTQALYALLGIALLAYSQLGEGYSGRLWAVIGVSLVVLVVVSGGFYWVQHQGLFRLLSRVARKFPRLFSRADQPIEEQAQAVDLALQALYRRRDRLLVASLWRVVFRLTTAAETWLVLDFLGITVSVAVALVLESLGQAIRSAAFLITGGLGVEEGGLMVVGAALGLPPALGLSLSLCKRVRELLIGVPGLLALQMEAGWRMLK